MMTQNNKQPYSITTDETGSTFRSEHPYCSRLSAEQRREATDSSDSLTLDPVCRWRIISSYTKTLEKHTSSVELESSLPFPKKLIRQAIYEELLENPDSELRTQLEVAFAQLESFLSCDEFSIIKDFELAIDRAQRMAEKGSPLDIIRSARVLREVQGDRAVRIQEHVSERMSRRLKQIRSIGKQPYTSVDLH